MDLGSKVTVKRKSTILPVAYALVSTDLDLYSVSATYSSCDLGIVTCAF